MTTDKCGNIIYNNSATTGTISWTNPNASIGAGSYGYSYVYPTPDPRVAKLEAEVAVLREMLAALLSGRELPKPGPRARKK